MVTTIREDVNRSVLDSLKNAEKYFGDILKSDESGRSIIPLLSVRDIEVVNAWVYTMESIFLIYETILEEFRNVNNSSDFRKFVLTFQDLEKHAATYAENTYYNDIDSMFRDISPLLGKVVSDTVGLSRFYKLCIRSYIDVMPRFMRYYGTWVANNQDKVVGETNFDISMGEKDWRFLREYISDNVLEDGYYLMSDIYYHTIRKLVHEID